MSEQKRSTPQRSDAPTQRRRSNASPRRRPSRRGGMPQWLSGWLEHMALFFSTLGARIRRIGPRARTVMRESRARNFPESNRFLVQVFLVIGGMFPMWRSLLHERVMAHRRQRSHAAGEHEDRWRRHARRVNPFYFIGGAAVVAAIALFFSFYTLGTTVEYNGSVVDTVASAAQARKAASKLESITTETLGKSYEIAQDAIHYSTAFVDFVENVRIAEGYVPTDSVMNLGEIAEILNSTKSGEVTYTVVKGDTWGQIANNNGMTAAELEALNPGYDINRIHIGDALTLSNAVPYLTVKVTERQNYVEDVNYDVNYVSDSSMYQGDERVISKGSFGKADIVADVTYVNGEEQERTVISSVTLSDPVAETRARGTKVRPTWYPTGSFRWPCSGRITSYFGYRSTGIRGATSNHKGIDIACSYGTPIYAADGGRVTYAGYKGAMGYVVIIDHNNGYVTYYEHNSSLLVSAGQTIYKGQQVAKAGRSGVASGVHCHFGIQRNGSYVNPLNYLS